MEWIYALITSVSSGIIVTALFFGFRYWMRPNITVANHICKTHKRSRKLDENGFESEYDENIYCFKFINQTKFDIENIEIDCFIVSDQYAGENGIKNYSLMRLPLKMDRFKFVRGKWNKNKTLNDNCYIIALSEIDCKLEEIWAEHKWIHLQISAYHSRSGFRKVIVKKFHDKKSCLKHGTFKSGETFEVLNNV